MSGGISGYGQNHLINRLRLTGNPDRIARIGAGDVLHRFAEMPLGADAVVQMFNNGARTALETHQHTTGASLFFAPRQHAFE